MYASFFPRPAACGGNRELLLQKNTRFEEPLPSAPDRTLRRNTRLAGTRTRFPAPGGRIPELRAGLAESIHRVHEAERKG